MPPLRTPGNASMVRARRPVGDDLVAGDPALDPQAARVGGPQPKQMSSAP